MDLANPPEQFFLFCFVFSYGNIIFQVCLYSHMYINTGAVPCAVLRMLKRFFFSFLQDDGDISHTRRDSST